MKKLEKERMQRFGVVNWRRAKGVKHHRGETNAGLAERDYSVPCKNGASPIVIFEGYHIWWCVPHHQPLAWCEKAKAEEATQTLTNLLVIARDTLNPRSITNKSSVSTLKLR